MKILKSLPILMALSTACGTSGSFDSGASSGGTRPVAKKSRTQSHDATQAQSHGGDGSEADLAQEREENVARPVSAPASTAEEAPPSLAFADQVGSAVEASLASNLTQKPNALSAGEAAKLTASLTAVAQGAALGKGAAANAAALKAVLALIGNLGNLKPAALPVAGAVNAAALADVAKAVQGLAAAAAALDLAGVQAAIADILKAIMDLIA